MYEGCSCINRTTVSMTLTSGTCSDRCSWFYVFCVLLFLMMFLTFSTMSPTLTAMFRYASLLLFKSLTFKWLDDRWCFWTIYLFIFLRWRALYKSMRKKFKFLTLTSLVISLLYNVVWIKFIFKTLRKIWWVSCRISSLLIPREVDIIFVEIYQYTLPYHVPYNHIMRPSFSKWEGFHNLRICNYHRFKFWPCKFDIKRM